MVKTRSIGARPSTTARATCARSKPTTRSGAQKRNPEGESPLPLHDAPPWQTHWLGSADDRPYCRALRADRGKS